MLYELINPSDAYVFEAQTEEVAVLTAWLLSPSYGARAKDSETCFGIPGFMDDPKAEFEARYGRTPVEAVMALRLEIAAAMESMILGNFKDWPLYQEAYGAIDDAEKRRNFKARWREKRTSMNDIGSEAERISCDLRKGA